MSLLQKINDDAKEAMKAKESATLSTLRMLKAALKNKQIELMHELQEEEIVAVLRSQIKQLKDSLESFVQGKREDLATVAKQELTVLEKYLPAEMDETIMQKTIKDALTAASLTTKADMGKAMGVAMKAVAGKANGARVKVVVEAILTALVLLIVAMPVAQAAVFDLPANPFAWTVFIMRLLRIVMLFFGIVCINHILRGSFEYMVASGNDPSREKALRYTTVGLIGAVIVIALFSAFTVSINQMTI